MTAYDPNQQQWLPPESPSNYGGVPADAQPMTDADRWALIAVAVSVSVLLATCLPGFSCLAPLVVGIIALTRVRSAANPERARTYSWIATGIGIVILLGVLAFIVFYGAVFFAALQQGDFRNFR